MMVIEFLICQKTSPHLRGTNIPRLQGRCHRGDSSPEISEGYTTVWGVPKLLFLMEKIMYRGWRLAPLPTLQVDGEDDQDSLLFSGVSKVLKWFSIFYTLANDLALHKKI